LIRINITKTPQPTRLSATSQECCGPVSDAALTTKQAEGLSVGFAALADPIRLKLFSLIAASPYTETCACHLVKPTGRSQPTVSHHLKVLREAGLLLSERRGTWVWYRVNHERLNELRTLLA
jgi:ArsR family transcriptional regulator, arsenate/arsenite/antimonite-responsive transcriptional repressor